MKKQNIRKALPAIGLVLVSVGAIMNNLLPDSSNAMHFIRGLLVGMGSVFIFSGLIKRKPKLSI